MTLTATDIFGRDALLVQGTMVTHQHDSDPLRDPSLTVRTGLISARIAAGDLWLNVEDVFHGRVRTSVWAAKDVHWCDEHCFHCPRTDLGQALRLYRLCMREIGAGIGKTKVRPWSPADRKLVELALTLRRIGAS